MNYENSNRRVLIYLALLYKGIWDDIYKHIVARLPVTDEDLEGLESKYKCKVVTILDDEYPQALKEIYKPPFVLFYYGDISLANNMRNCVSVVGSRKANSYGMKTTLDIARVLSNDYIIVSGLAKGIDAYAHQGAIETGGKTIAVLGTGIERCYPAENLELYLKIKENHLLMSEYPNDDCNYNDAFPMRNRIIAGLSCTTIVTQAKIRSGTSITVFHALNTGRLVCAVPYEMYEDSFCNLLISEGAYMVINPDDILEEINFHFGPKEDLKNVKE